MLYSPTMIRLSTHRGAVAQGVRVLVLAAATLALLSLAACGATLESSVTRSVTPPYYNWDGFSQSGQRYTYTDGATVASKTGIDVSEAQGVIDWNAVRADGIEFALIRVGYRGSTEGHVYLDDYYTANMQGARAAGLQCGAYFFSQAVSIEEAQEEAAFLIDALGGTPLEYPVVFDYEIHVSGVNSRASGVSGQVATEIARTFCEAVEAAGYSTMIYGNGNDLGRFDSRFMKERPVWFAEYGALPSYKERFVIWQYTNEGTVAGISGAVDLNLELEAWNE